MTIIFFFVVGFLLMLYAGFEEMDAQKWGRDVPARAQYMFGAGAAMVIMALFVWSM